MFQIFLKNCPDPLKMHFWAFFTKFNSKTKHFQCKSMIKMAYLGRRLQGVQISVWLLFSLDSYLSPKLEKILLAADRRQFWLIFGKIWSLIFEPYEEWSWNFQDSILFMKAFYGLSSNKIWGVSHGHFWNSWWFAMEWPRYNVQNTKIPGWFSFHQETD